MHYTKKEFDKDLLNEGTYNYYYHLLSITYCSVFIVKYFTFENHSLHLPNTPQIN